MKSKPEIENRKVYRQRVIKNRLGHKAFRLIRRADLVEGKQILRVRVTRDSNVPCHIIPVELTRDKKTGRLGYTPIIYMPVRDGGGHYLLDTSQIFKRAAPVWKDTDCIDSFFIAPK